MKSNKLLPSEFSFHTVTSSTIAALAGFNVGWHISVPNMPQDVISKCSDGLWSPNQLPACLPMSDSIWGITVGTFALGGLVGSIASKYCNSHFGRKANIIIAGIWMVLGGLISTLSINTAMYTMGRLFVGVSAGMSGSSVGIYVSEISTKKTRGALGCLYELFLNLGILLSQVSGFYMSYVPVWRYLWAIPTILTTLQIIIFYLFAIESPRYLCSRGQFEKAKSKLVKLRGEENKKLVELELTELETHNNSQDDEIVKTLTIPQLFTKDKNIRKKTLIVTVIQMYNQIGGIGPMSIYSVDFLTSVFSGNTNMATQVTLASSAGAVLATFISVIYMHHIGRKGFMLISTTGMFISSLFLVIGSTAPQASQLAPLSITASILFIFTYSMGCGVIPWMIAPELLPLNALPSGSAIANAANWLVNFVVNTIWPPMSVGLKGYSFVVFTAINFIGILFVWFIMPETTGKDLDTLANSSIMDYEEKEKYIIET